MNDNMTVIIAIYKEPYKLVEKCLWYLINQKNVILEIIILNQIRKFKDTFIQSNYQCIHSLKYFEIDDISLSYARNYGINIANNNCIAFIDPDIIVGKNWASSIIDEFKKDSSVGIIGGKIIPKFSREPCWFYKSRYICDIYSLLDIGSEVKYVKKIVGANFAINRELIKDNKFREDLGRMYNKLLGGEETDFCERIAKRGIKIKYVPNAIAYHYISNERLKIGWILKRFYYGGISRGLRGGNPEPYPQKIGNKLIDIILLPIFITPYIVGLIKGMTIKKYMSKSDHK